MSEARTQMSQRVVQAALDAYVNDDNREPWNDVIRAIRAGDVLVENRVGSLTLRATGRPMTVELGQRLNQLREDSGMTYEDIARELEISTSTVQRQMRGYNLASWPMVLMMIKAMGGDPEDYRHDYVAAKREKNRKD